MKIPFGLPFPFHLQNFLREKQIYLRILLFFELLFEANVLYTTIAIRLNNTATVKAHSYDHTDSN